MSIQNDATRMLVLMANDFKADDLSSKGRLQFSGEELAEKLSISFEQAIDAAKYLDNRGLVKRIAFSSGEINVQLNTEGRAVAEKISVDQNPRSTELKILFLGANPEATARLAIDVEAREVESKIRSSEYRSNVRFITKWAVRPDDLVQALNEELPHIVHFSAHANGSSTLMLQSVDGHPIEVKPRALVALFKAMKDNIRLIVINACNSDTLAQALVEHVDCTVGMSSEIRDDAARCFSASFYRAIGFGRSVQNAFDQAVAQIALEGLEQEEVPRLYVRKDIDTRGLYLMATESPESPSSTGR